MLFLFVFFVADASLDHIYRNTYTSVDTRLSPNEPDLIGPDRLCNVFGSVRGTFSGAGEPGRDVYKWTIIAPDGRELFTRAFGDFPTIEYTFELLGVHKIQLEIQRGGISQGSIEKEVAVIQGPILTLERNYQLCGEQTLDLQAISPSSPDFSGYTFEWTDESGNIIGSANDLTVDSAGKYTVKFYFTDSEGVRGCETSFDTEVSIQGSISLSQSSSVLCYDSEIIFETVPPTSGQWFLTFPGATDPTPITTGSDLTVIPQMDLSMYGTYEVTLIINNAGNPSCSPELSAFFDFYAEPKLSLIATTNASECLVPDGELTLLAETDIEQLSIESLGLSFGPYNSGETIVIPGLKSGAYTLSTILNGCVSSMGTVVPLQNPPSALEFSIENIIPESCTDTGKQPGFFDVNLLNGATTGFYRILNERGDEIRNTELPSQNPFTIELGGGKYFFEIRNENDCDLPSSSFIEIPAIPQTNFSVPEELTICQTFNFIPETEENLLFTLTAPSGEKTIKNAGESFTITEAGEYTIIGILPDQNEICPRLKTFEIKTTEPVLFEPVLQDEDCIIGNRIYGAEISNADPSSVNYYWRNEQGDLIGTGSQLLLAPTSVGTFSLEVQPKESEACPISPKGFKVDPPVLSVEASITSTLLCEFGPEAIVELTTTSPEAVTTIKWRRFNAAGEIVELDFDNQWEITTRIGGIYEASVYNVNTAINKNCELGRVTFHLDLTPEKVAFDIPELLNICDFHELTPDTDRELEFFITTPSGDVLERSSGQPITLDQAGIYTFLAFDTNSPPTYCPEQKELTVTLADAVDFQPILTEEFCDGSKIYQASISNYPLEEVEISWKDEQGNEVGSGEFLTVTIPGVYTLEVQPSGVIPCHISPIPFEIAPPVFAVDVTLIADPLCPDAPSANIRAEADFSSVATIEWWYTSPEGRQSELVEERNKEEISAVNEGTYEVRLFNQIPCSLGLDKVLLLRSADTLRPSVEETYQICPKYEIAPTINPGSFSVYEWYFENQLISTAPGFKPLSVGDYRLIVFSEEGCAYQADFTTEEECDLKVIYPNAVQPGNPDKEFLIYTNYLIDELDLVILNKWGQVIFQCSQSNLISEEYTCTWDGTYNGKTIPNGSYALRVNYKNHSKNISKSEFGSILIID